MLRTLVAIALLVAGTSAPLAQPQSPLTPEQIYQRSCGNILNLLPRIVRKDAVAAIPADARVNLHRVCAGVQLNDFGNAAGLGHAIAANAALRAALAHWNYRADDVVGIAIEGNSVQLYVHRQ
jgi:hypothetical protein